MNPSDETTYNEAPLDNTPKGPTEKITDKAIDIATDAGAAAISGVQYAAEKVSDATGVVSEVGSSALGQFRSKAEGALSAIVNGVGNTMSSWAREPAGGVNGDADSADATAADTLTSIANTTASTSSASSSSASTTATTPQQAARDIRPLPDVNLNATSGHNDAAHRQAELADELRTFSNRHRARR